MKQKQLEKMFIDEKTDKLSFSGNCHDCKKETTVLADWNEDGIIVTGGAVYKPDNADGDIFVKCPQCYHQDKVLRNYRVTDVYTRTVGYYAVKRNMNKGKQSEIEMRKPFKIQPFMV